MNKFKEIVKSDKFKKTLYVILAILILLFTFQLGMLEGFEKAYFSDKVGGDYFMEMHGMMGNFLNGLKPGDFTSPHGAIGKIIEIKLPTLTIEDVDGNDKTIQISSSTQIKSGNDSNEESDLKVDDMVIVFGPQDDDNPVIDARLIRLLPPIPSAISSSTPATTNNASLKN